MSLACTSGLDRAMKRFGVSALRMNFPVAALRVDTLLTRKVLLDTFRTVVLLVDFTLSTSLG